LAARRAGRGSGVDKARSSRAEATDPGWAQAACAPGEPGATGTARGRGPALDRLGNTGMARSAGREPADGAPAALGELPAGVRSRLGAQDVLPAGAARHAPDDERGGVAAGAARDRERSGGAPEA